MVKLNENLILVLTHPKRCGHLQHGGGLALFTGPAHGGGAGLGAQLVEARPCVDAVGEPRHSLQVALQGVRMF